MARIKAITFDLWDTVFVDDSDEAKRQAQGLPGKKVARRDLVEQFLSARGAPARSLIDCAYDTADAAFRRVWHEQHVTWTVAERLQVVLAGLGQSLPDSEMADLVRLHEEMELQVSPDLVPGVVEAIEALAPDHPLIVISDAIFSPGWALRQLLVKHGLRDHFSGFVFSDEIGCSKPAAPMFERAAELAGCAVEELVHLGDRESNDIAGPQALGARAVLITAAVDRNSADSRADAVCRDYRELPRIISTLNGA